jgi:hypothetical protein
MDREQGTVTIRVWAVTILAGVALSVLSLSFTYGALNNKTEVNANKIEVIDKALGNKVNYTPEFKMIQEQLNRIENKLDGHIAK